MKFSTDAAALNAALRSVLRVVPSANANPALTGVRLVTKGDHLEVTGTDLTTTITTTLSITPDEPGEVLLPGKLLGSILASASGLFTLAFDDVDAVLTADGVTTRLSPLEATTFPVFYVPEGESFTLDPSVLSGAIEPVLPAVSTNPNLGAQTGVLLEIDDTTLTLTATDSYRLITLSRPLEETAPHTRIVVPPTILSLFTKLSPTELNVTVSDTELVLATESLTVRTRLVAGEFPVYQLLFENVGTEKLVLPSTELLELLARVAPTASVARIVTVTIADGTLSLSTKGEYGSSTGAIALEDEAHAFEFAVNLDFLTQALKVLEGEVTLTHSTPQRPILLSAAPQSPRCLLVPLRTNQ